MTFRITGPSVTCTGGIGSTSRIFFDASSLSFALGSWTGSPSASAARLYEAVSSPTTRKPAG